jgi:hypothetical protein
MKLVLLVCIVAVLMTATSADDDSKIETTVNHLNPPPFIGSLLEFICLPFRSWINKEDLQQSEEL